MSGAEEFGSKHQVVRRIEGLYLCLLGVLYPYILQQMMNEHIMSQGNKLQVESCW